MKNGHLMNLYVRPGRRGQREPWAAGHEQAIYHPRDQFERALVELYTGWLRYADAHQRSYGSGIGDDGFLGEEWCAIGVALRQLLNGERGRLDGGTLDSLVANALRAEGFEPPNL